MIICSNNINMNNNYNKNNKMTIINKKKYYIKLDATI